MSRARCCSSFPPPVTRLHRLPTFDSCTRACTLRCTVQVFNHNMQGFFYNSLSHTHTHWAGSRSTQCTLRLFSDVIVMRPLVSIFNLAFSCIFNSASTKHFPASILKFNSAHEVCMGYRLRALHSLWHICEPVNYFEHVHSGFIHI